MEDTVKQRLVRFINSKQMSVREFERSISVSNGYVKGISKGLGVEILRRITDIYPTLNEEWLLYGEGEMLNPTAELQESGQPFLPSSGARLRPYYTDLPVSGGAVAQYPDILRQTSDGTLYLPELRSAEFFFPVIGCSMRPTVPEGAIVGVAHVDRYETIDPDRIYLIITADNQRMIKHIVHYDSQSETLTLASDNRDYPAFSLPATLIRDIYRVVCTLAIATL